jgi:hypothetical protein
MPMVAAQAFALEHFLAGQGLLRKPGGSSLLSGAGAKLTRASALPARRLSERSSLLELLAGKRGFVELAARRSSGRFSLALAALAAATSAGEAAALVDLGDHLDPQGAEEAGVDLSLLLWVRPQRAKQVLAAAETLLSAGFPLVVADFGLSPRGARWLPEAAWVRLSRAVEARGAALLITTPWRMSGIAAQSAVSAGSARPLWHGLGREPRLLVGLSSRLTLDKDLCARSGLSEPLSLSASWALPPLSPGEGRGEVQTVVRALA